MRADAGRGGTMVGNTAQISCSATEEEDFGTAGIVASSAAKHRTGDTHSRQRQKRRQEAEAGRRHLGRLTNIDGDFLPRAVSEVDSNTCTPRLCDTQVFECRMPPTMPVYPHAVKPRGADRSARRATSRQRVHWGVAVDRHPTGGRYAAPQDSSQQCAAASCGMIGRPGVDG